MTQTTWGEKGWRAATSPQPLCHSHTLCFRSPTTLPTARGATFVLTVGKTIMLMRLKCYDRAARPNVDDMRDRWTWARGTVGRARNLVPRSPVRTHTWLWPSHATSNVDRPQHTMELDPRALQNDPIYRARLTSFHEARARHVWMPIVQWRGQETACERQLRRGISRPVTRWDRETWLYRDSSMCVPMLTIGQHATFGETRLAKIVETFGNSYLLRAGHYNC
jgi:hypothetical protein